MISFYKISLTLFNVNSGNTDDQNSCFYTPLPTFKSNFVFQECLRFTFQQAKAFLAH